MKRRIVGTFVAAATATATAAASLVAGGTATAAQPAAHRAPVVFVHGYLGSDPIWAPAKAAFLANGYRSDELFGFVYDYNTSNETSARGLAAFVEKVKKDTGAPKVDIVNHSMGGMVSMWYVKELGGSSSVGHVASLAGAHHGTDVAALCTVMSPSCEEMKPGSAFLKRLASGDETPGDTRYRTWYSPCDGVISPFFSTRLSGAENTLVPCVNHVAFLTDGGVLSQVAAFTKGE
ncbi:alpha/beta fold hydrolase [Streptomyces mobaraensis NBRC 13819 = DSM 40847]|uniref:Lipase class 2 n=1 Tax=Streptomyces mobaraensis (strain ATCC 29032 / DSM 40847 / JCM 4168 / NBRC 13819 / NCIMB 11159 / IPCR 16-22) TaxID=1223523 RepID=M3C9A2_STRM1|nr:alpha/beta fold hydrolase [Streptomyces mobaraensis]EMF00541.1 lipase class 2 [Streptomyces mobaraensis NBRC 13819 = DSM 40847]QTT73911.1 alpha/beta fold hydrolase [Streptomyces mobaraensis NBRC 13819 = DSM 40847]